jgi:hypothetical protein
MRLRWTILGLLWVPCLAMGQSDHRFKLFNDMPSLIESFTVSPANGSEPGAKLDFDSLDQPFEYGASTMVEVRGGDGCLFDLQTRLSNGEWITTHNVNLCAIHVYRPGLRIDKVYFGTPWSP